MSPGLYIFCWNNKYILDDISRIWVRIIIIISLFEFD